MKATELRIGNLVLFEFDNKTDYHTIVPKDIHVINLCSNLEGDAGYKPIPITEEWLMRFGFFKNNNAWVLQLPDGNQTHFRFSIWEDLSYNTGELLPPLESVHQLQNLYFALTGEELTDNNL